MSYDSFALHVYECVGVGDTWVAEGGVGERKMRQGWKSRRSTNAANKEISLSCPHFLYSMWWSFPVDKPNQKLEICWNRWSLKSLSALISCDYALYHLGQFMLANTNDKAWNLSGLVSRFICNSHRACYDLAEALLHQVTQRHGCLSLVMLCSHLWPLRL